MMAVVPAVLEDENSFPQMAEFFISLKPKYQNEYEKLSFAKLLTSNNLPVFSDKSDTLEKYTVNGFVG